MKVLTVVPVLFSILLGACSHTPDPVKLTSPAGAETEIKQQEQLLTEASKSHVDVLAPKQYEGSYEHLNAAKKKQKDGDTDAAVYESLGISKAYLNEANQQAIKYQDDLSFVLAAREKSRQAGGGFLGAVRSVDKELITYTVDKDSYKKLKNAQKSKLEARYLGVELVAIKQQRLATARKTLDEARGRGADRLIPNTYNQAENDFRKAEKAIESDRHGQGNVHTAIKTAEASATKALTLVLTAQKAQGLTPEERAITLQEREQALQSADQLNAKALDENMAQENALAVQGAALGYVASENADLQRRQREDQVINQAASMFDESEAEVYRQGDKLVIRLKEMKFSTGHSELPSTSVPLLGKVKDALKQLGPSKVVVEGHTDGVGTAKVNQKLSQERADAVAKYFQSDENMSSNKFETEGFGYTKPLASNKTKEGRAQNRRVDIVVAPAQSM